MTRERRRDDRLPVMWQGKLVDDQETPYACEVRDISHAGALVSCDQAFPIGTDLLLSIDGLNDFAGRVKWAGSDALGLLLLAGDDLALKRFAEGAGSDMSTHPTPPEGDPGPASGRKVFCHPPVQIKSC